MWYLRRRHARSGHAFSALDDDDEEHPHSITAVRIGGTPEKGPRILAPLGPLGLGPSRRYMNRSRREILADEDRSFNRVGVSREGSHGRSSLGVRSARSSIRGLSNAVTESFASIRNLARGVGLRHIRGRCRQTGRRWAASRQRLRSWRRASRATNCRSGRGISSCSQSHRNPIRTPSQTNMRFARLRFRTRIPAQSLALA